MKMFDKEWDFEEVAMKVDEIRSLGIESVYLSRGEMPYHLVRECELSENGEWVKFMAVYYNEGHNRLDLEWRFELNTTNINLYKEALQKLKGDTLIQFKRYLIAYVYKLRVNADGLKRTMDRLYETIKEFENMIEYILKENQEKIMKLIDQK